MATFPSSRFTEELGFSGCPCRGSPRLHFLLTLAVLTSVACCSFFLRIPPWCSSPSWMRSISSLSLSSKTRLSMLSAISTGFAHVLTSPVAKLLQNRYSSFAASRDADTILTFLPTPQWEHLTRYKPREMWRPAPLHASEKGSPCFLGIPLLWFGEVNHRPGPAGDPVLYLPLLLGFPSMYHPFLASIADRLWKEYRVFLQQLLPPFMSLPLQLPQFLLLLLQQLQKELHLLQFCEAGCPRL